MEFERNSLKTGSLICGCYNALVHLVLSIRELLTKCNNPLIPPYSAYSPHFTVSETIKYPKVNETLQGARHHPKCDKGTE
jgi:hypothetical protein